MANAISEPNHRCGGSAGISPASRLTLERKAKQGTFWQGAVCQGWFGKSMQAFGMQKRLPQQASDPRTLLVRFDTCYLDECQALAEGTYSGAIALWHTWRNKIETLRR